MLHITKKCTFFLKFYFSHLWKSQYIIMKNPTIQSLLSVDFSLCVFGVTSEKAELVILPIRIFSFLATGTLLMVCNKNFTAHIFCLNVSFLDSRHIVQTGKWVACYVCWTIVDLLTPMCVL